MRLVLVEWVDASGGIRSGWRPLAEIKKTSAPMPALSVGWIIRDDEDCVTVCPHRVGEDHDQGDGELAIPKSWVIRMVDLIEKKRR
jgi:hypothetical protein